MKGKTLPFIVTFVVIIVIVYLFTNISQSEVVCEKKSIFEDVLLNEKITSILDGKKISRLIVTKAIILPERYANETVREEIQSSLHRTLEYLGKKVNYKVYDDQIIVTMDVHKNEVLLLDNIRFTTGHYLEILVNSNTKSNDVIPLTIGDSYTDGEFMTFMKSRGYHCK